MALVEFPNELGKAYWDKKKGAVPAGSPLESQLKTFEKKFQATDWKPFDAGWEQKAKTPKELDDAWAAVDRAYRAKVFALKFEAQAVADAAQKLLKEKGLPKPTLDAAKTITDTVKAFGKEVDQGLESLNKVYDKASAALKASAKDSSEDEEESGSQLLEPKRLLSQLQQCKRNAERRVHFGFVNDNKAPPVLCLAPKTSGKRLFALLQTETGIKTGAFGQAWIAEEVLYLSMEKPYAGLVKKVRAPLKAVGFKVRKIVLAGEDGAVVEEDEESETEGQGSETSNPPPTNTTPEPDTGVPPAPPSPDETFAQKLSAMQPAVARGLASNSPVAAKIQPLLDFAQAKAAGGNPLAGLQALQTLEKLLATIPTEDKPGGTPPLDRSKAFNARLAAMQPAIKAAMAGPLAGQLKQWIAAIGSAKGDMDAAEAALDAIESLLSNAPGPETTEMEGEWLRQRAAVEGRYTAVLSGMPAEANRIRIAMETAIDLADAGRYADAIAQLKQLESLLDAAAGQGRDADLPVAGLVEYVKSLHAFEDSYRTAMTQIQSLKKAIPAQLPAEADLADQLASGLQSFAEQLKDLVDKAMSAAKDERAPTTDALIDGLQMWRQEISNNGLIAHVDSNPFGVEVSVGKLLGDALNRILSSVPSTT